MVSAIDAAEIARGAALQIIADRDTLIANLRTAGYTVTKNRPPKPIDTEPQDYL